MFSLIKADDLRNGAAPYCLAEAGLNRLPTKNSERHDADRSEGLGGGSENNELAATVIAA